MEHYPGNDRSARQHLDRGFSPASDAAIRSLLDDGVPAPGEFPGTRIVHSRYGQDEDWHFIPPSSPLVDDFLLETRLYAAGASSQYR